jgi:amino-acid N-acetyltransferase
MQHTISIQKAVAGNFDAIGTLLLADNLPTSDINPLLDNFFIAVEDNEIIGVIGMDKYGTEGLLRSAVVKASHRSTGVAAALVHHLLEAARQSGVNVLYLITNTAEEYFANKGFEKITRDVVPATVLQSKEFNGLCPASSVIMYRQL